MKTSIPLLLRTLFSAASFTIGCFSPILAQASGGEMMLLLPDGTDRSQPQVRVWFDAAQELGLKLIPISDSELLTQPGALARNAGLILPDGVHKTMSGAVVNAISQYTSNGGSLMLVYDAGSLDERGFYPLTGPSRLSPLAGVQYVLSQNYPYLSGLGPIAGMSSWLRMLDVPPGKSMPYTWSSNSTTLTDYIPASAGDPGGTTGYDHARFLRVPPKRQRVQSLPQPDDQPSKIVKVQKRGKGGKAPAVAMSVAADQLEAISGYVYGYLSYPSFDTDGPYSGEIILSSPDHGVVAGINQFGNGNVLFVNTPLAYLATNGTDSMLLHGFLNHFGSKLNQLPKLSPMPDAKGGLVFNWHVEGAEAIDAIHTLDKGIRLWDYGPFSIHITTGPDIVIPGDAQGIDYSHSPKARNSIAPLMKKDVKSFGDSDWLAKVNYPDYQAYFKDMKSFKDWFVRQKPGVGHDIGSHGGWVHDYWCSNAVEDGNPNYKVPHPSKADVSINMVDYLQLNQDDLRNLTGKSYNQSFSMPCANYPAWALAWLQDHGVNSYYFAGHTGSGPTRAYTQNGIPNPNMWAFPVTPFGRNAVFDEFDTDPAGPVSKADLAAWYDSLIDFAVENRTARLIYAHPPYAVNYMDTIEHFLGHAKSYGNKFRWYAMDDLTQFQQQRLAAKWSVTDAANGALNIDASHDRTLEHLTWQLPRSAFGKPVVLAGKADIRKSNLNWLVVANRHA